MSSDAIVHVIDDDEAVRDSLAFLLSSAHFLVETYESANIFLGKLPQSSAGCIITDVRMPGLSGIDLLRRVKETKLSLPVIIMTGHGDVPLAVEAMKAGASDFIEKPVDDEVMLAAVRRALNRQEADIQRSAEYQDISTHLEALSGRERQVLEGLVAGHPNKIIAFNLNISPRTVEIYRANVMTKMQAGSLSELVRMALVIGLLDSAK
jgi:two-component system response regulator FixJ